MRRAETDRQVANLATGGSPHRSWTSGFSAGACVLAPSLLDLERCDRTDEAMSMYGSVEFDGLHILDRAFVPHRGNPDHPENQILTQVAAAYTREGRPFWALTDGQAWVVDGGKPDIHRGRRRVSRRLPLPHAEFT